MCTQKITCVVHILLLHVYMFRLQSTWGYHNKEGIIVLICGSAYMYELLGCWLKWENLHLSIRIDLIVISSAHHLLSIAAMQNRLETRERTRTLVLNVLKQEIPLKNTDFTYQ